jgi:CheY-like chemotaxis protein
MNRILVIEDNAVASAVYRSTLVREGHQVEVATDGQSGLAALQREPPSLLILDLMLPGMDGIAVLQRIRATAGLEHIPVVVISNAYTPERLDQVWRAGATQVLTKANSTPKEIARVVREVLSAKADR